MANPAKNALSAKIVAMREAVRRAQEAAAAGGAPLPAQPQMPQAQRVGIGNQATAAVGEDIPRPRPAPLAGGGPVPAAVREQLDALRAKRDKFQQDVQAGLTGDQLDPLTVEEGLLLARHGEDPMQIFGRALSQDEIALLLRRISEGRPVTADQVMALQRSSRAEAVADEAAVPQRAASVVIENGVPQMIGEDGQRLGEAVAIPASKTRPALYEFDGRAYQLNETGDGLVDVGQATREKTPEQVDADLAASDMDLTPTPLDNLTRNKVARDPPAELAQMVTQYTTNAPLESLDVSAVKKLWRQISTQYPAGSPARASLEAAFSTWRRDPEAPNAPVPDYALRGIEDGRRRLAALEAMATDPSFTQQRVAAETLDRARAATQASGRPLPPRQSLVPQVAGLPAAIEQFNSLPPALRESVANRVANSDTGRGVNVAALLDSGPDGPAISPNTAASLMRAQGAVGELLEDLDAAMRSGDTAAADAARSLIREADPEERAAAISQWQRRLALDAALRDAMQAVEPSPAVAMSPGQPPIRPQGALTPDPQTIEVPEGQLPGPFEEAGAGYAEAQARLRDTPSLQYRVAPSVRLQAAGLDPKNPRNPAFYGADRPELRSYGDRLIDSNDRRRIRAVQELPLAMARLEEARKAAESAKGVKQVAAATRRLDVAMEEVAELKKSLPRDRVVVERNSVPLKDDDHPSKGVDVRVESALPAWPDKRLNRAASARTYDDLLAAMLGRRPKTGESLARSSDTLSPADVNAVRDSVLDEFGGDAADVVPDGRDGSLDAADLESGGPRKSTPLGGRQQPSRVMGALRAMFGDTNPLALKQAGPNNTAVLLYANADEVADDLLARASGYRPGTPDYDLARQDLSDIVREYYGRRTNPLDAIEAKTAEGVTGTPAGDQRPGTTRNPSQVPQQAQSEWPSEYQRQIDPAGPLGYRPNTEGYEFRPAQGFGDWDGAADPIDTTGDVASLDRSLLDSPADDADGGANLAASGAIDMGGDLPNAGGSKPAAAGDASSGTLPAVGGGAGKPAASPKPQSKKAILADIKERSKVVYEETLQSEKDAGATAAAAKKAARKAQDDFIAAERASLEKGGESSAAGSGVTSPGQQPAVTAGTDSAAAPTGPAAAAQITATGDLSRVGAGQIDVAATPSPQGGQIDVGGDLPGVGAAGRADVGGGPRPVDVIDDTAIDDAVRRADEEAARSADADGTRQADGSTKAGDAGKQPRTWKEWLRKSALPTAAWVGGAGVGYKVLTGLNTPPSELDIPVPAGGGAGGTSGGGQGLPPGYIPASSQTSAGTTEERLQRVLDRLNAARRGGSSGGDTYATYQNVNFWR